MAESPPSRAAWIEISPPVICFTVSSSPPSRAAWIEIYRYRFCPYARLRRRLHGRRGLKYAVRPTTAYRKGSPPSRAAWIEIKWVDTDAKPATRRRLHGRRGLKSQFTLWLSCNDLVAAFTGGVD